MKPLKVVLRQICGTILLIGEMAMAVGAATISPGDASALIEFIHCADAKCLKDIKTRSTRSQLIELVYFSRLIQFSPTSKEAAGGLIHNAPQKVDELDSFATLAGSLSRKETVSDMRALAKIYFAYPKNLANAALRIGDFRSFLAFGRIAIVDSHLDYPQEAVRICKARHDAFLRGFLGLSANDQSYFRTRVMNPQTCGAIAKTESDN